ncbi:hypothetical protein ACN47E_004157 [Coniothyrium glycines]
MPDSKGWRKKKLPKDLGPLKTSSEEAVTPADGTDRRRHHHSWRKTISGSRPQSPLSATPATPTLKDIDDAASGHSEPTPRRDSKPKLARYTSLFSSFKEATRGPEFAEPWDAEAAPHVEPYADVDPLYALQSVRNHMHNCSTRSIPPEYNNALFRIFEDYGKVREANERLETITKEALAEWKRSEKDWGEAEAQYQSEIRRLELLIARGASGMTALMHARRGSLVDRERRHRSTIPHGNTASYQIAKGTDQYALFQRSIPPTATPIASSKEFARQDTTWSVGNTAMDGPNFTLSRKAYSELNLAKFGEAQALQTHFDSDTMNLALPGGRESTPNIEKDEYSSEVESLSVESDAIDALRHVGASVAKQRGLEVSRFLRALMTLLSTVPVSSENSSQDEEACPTRPIMGEVVVSRHFSEAVPPATPKPIIDRTHRQSTNGNEQRLRRHFSFEIGADTLENEYESYGCCQLDDPPTVLDSTRELENQSEKLQPASRTSSPSSQTLGTDFYKPSKIPSPVQMLGHMRRENSSSSLTSLVFRRRETRRDSRTSIMTAYQQSSSDKFSCATPSKSSSGYGSDVADSGLHARNGPSSPHSGSLDLSLTAAKVANSSAATEGKGSVVGSPSSTGMSRK